MDLTATLDADCTVGELRVWVSSLDRYSEWLTIVPRAEFESGSDPAAWSVELRAKVGPIARSKRLRMIRTIDEPTHVRFERQEVDGRNHSAWVLDAEIESQEVGARLIMKLHYGGGSGAGLFERLLNDEIETSKRTLRALVESNANLP